MMKQYDETVVSNQGTEHLQNEPVVYCGLAVQLIDLMPNCSLIRYLETADLQKSLTRSQAACTIDQVFKTLLAV
jgi:hypothetical protein